MALLLAQLRMVGARTAPPIRVAWRQKIGRATAATFLMALIAGCSPAPHAPCAAGMGKPDLLFTLFFGRSVPGRDDVTQREWWEFEARTLTPLLPGGYTVVDANGAWMSPVSRTTVHEATKVVIAALPDTPASLAAINRVRDAYQALFHQQLVGMTAEHACAAF